MQTRIFNIWTIILALALLTGIIWSGFFPFMYLAIGTAAAMALTVLGFVVDLVVKSSKGIRITGFMFIFFLVAALTSFARLKISENAATRLGDKVIHSLYDYKHRTGHFPEDISQLTLDDKIKAAFSKDQHYWTDSTMQQFEIRSWNDGWNTKTFRSGDSTWVLLD